MAARTAPARDSRSGRSPGTVSPERRWSGTRALRAWIRSPLFAHELRDFLLLWVVVKGVNAVTAAQAGLPPFAFRPATEAAALAVECVGVWVFTRRAREHVLLANLGIGLPLFLAPFTVLHLTLGLILAAAA